MVAILMILGICAIALTLVLAVHTVRPTVSTHMQRRHIAVDKHWHGAKTYPKFN